MYVCMMILKIMLIRLSSVAHNFYKWWMHLQCLKILRIFYSVG